MHKPPNPASINELVARYEAMVDAGEALFLDEPTYEVLIHHYEEEAQIDRALEVVDLALSQFSFSVDLHLKKAALLLSQNEPDPAMGLLDKAAALAPGEPEVDLLRAEVLIHLKEFDAAQDQLMAIKAEASRSLLSDILTVEAIIFEAQHQFERVFIALEAALHENPANIEAMDRIWVAIEHCNYYQKGVELFERILDHDPYTATAWYYLGNIRAFFIEYDEAIACYEYAFLSDETFEAAYRECAELCFESKLFHKALSIYEEVLDHFEADGELLLRMGQCHQALGRGKVARTYFMQVLHHDPFDEEALFHLGMCHALERRWSKAIRYYLRALQIDDSHEEYHDSLAFAYQQNGMMKEAEASYARAVAAAPEHGLYWAHYACFLLDTERGKEALTLLDEAEELATGSEILYCRVAILFHLGRRKEGLFWLGETLSEYFDEHQALFDLMPALENDPDIASMISAFYNA